MWANFMRDKLWAMTEQQSQSQTVVKPGKTKPITYQLDYSANLKPK